MIENIQREDLNAIETAHAYERLGRELGLSQEEIGRRTGKDRTNIANSLRLLKLPIEVQLLLAEHRLSPWGTRVLSSGCLQRNSKLKSLKRRRHRVSPCGKWKRWSRIWTSDRARTGHKKDTCFWILTSGQQWRTWNAPWVRGCESSN